MNKQVKMLALACRFWPSVMMRVARIPLNGKPATNILLFCSNSPHRAPVLAMQAKKAQL